MCSSSYSNQKTSNQQFRLICVSVFLVPLYGFDLLNSVGHCSTQTTPIQGAIATQSIFANSWKIYSSFNFLLGSLLHKSFSRDCASYRRHTDTGSTPQGLQKIDKGLSRKQNSVLPSDQNS